MSPLWDANTKPKNLPSSGKYDKKHVVKTNRGWAVEAGSPATGNGNENADMEVLVAGRSLQHATDSAIGNQSSSSSDSVVTSSSSSSQSSSSSSSSSSST